MVRADCTYSRTGEGLHRFVDPADDRVYLYSQFEVPDARRVFTTFEQPDLKAPYTFTVTAPAHWKVVSNAPTPEPREAGDGVAVWRFPPTKPMSTYITALVAGEYHEVHDTYEGKHGEIPLGHYCRQSLVEHLDADELVKLTEQGFAFFEEAFDYPYPFGKYDQLYVPEYNMGAMENAGCVTLRDEYLPRSRQDRSFYEFRAEVILHEMAHMWFGDLVTMKWWDDLWLNESFAEWACYHAAVEATEFTESWTGFTNARKNWAYRQDQLPSTHPIAADNYDLQAVEVNFDGITYAKGASVLKQLVAWVGLEKFLEGLRDYFKDHAFAQRRVHATCSVALEKASGRELDVVGAGVAADLRRQHAARRSSSSTRTAPTRRSRSRRPRRPTTRRCAGTASASASTTSVDGRLVRRTSRRGRRRGRAPRSPSWSASGSPTCCCSTTATSTYAKIRLDERSLATVVGGLGPLDDSLARALCWGAAWDMTRDAEMSATDFVDLVLANIGTETDAFGVSRIPGVRRPGGQQLTPPRRNRPALTDDLGAGAARAARRPPSRAATTSCPSSARSPPPRTATQALDRPRGAARRLPDPRGPRGRHRPALDAAAPGWPAPAAPTPPGSTRSWRATTPSPARSTPPPPAPPARPPRPRPRRGSWRWCATTSPTRRSAASCWPSRRPARTRCSTPYVEKYLAAADTMWEQHGTQKASTALEFIFPRPLASRRAARPGRRLAGDVHAPTRPRSATSTRAAPTWRAASPARPRTPSG